MSRRSYFNPGMEHDEYSETHVNEWVDVTDEPGRANLISSLNTDGTHSPALDIDIPCRYVPSSTEGHGHLYFDDISLSWGAYKRLLYALEDAGIIDEKYVMHSIRNRMTTLRPEGVRK